MAITSKYLTAEQNELLINAGFLYIGGCWCEGTPREEFKRDTVLLKIYPARKLFKSTLNLNQKHPLDELEKYIQQISPKV